MLVIILVASCLRIGQRSNRLTGVVLYSNRLISIRAVTDGEFHRSIYRYGDREVTIAVLVGVESTVRRYAGRKRREIVFFRHVAHNHLKVHKRTSNVLYELNLLQTGFGIHATAEVDVILRSIQLNDLRAEFGLLTRCSVMVGSLCRRRAIPVPNLDISSVVTTTGTKGQFQLTGYRCFGKAGIAATVEFNTIQAVLCARTIGDLTFKIQSVVRTTSRSCLRIIPQQVVGACHHGYAHQSRCHQREDLFHVNNILVKWLFLKKSAAITFFS